MLYSLSAAESTKAGPYPAAFQGDPVNILLIEDTNSDALLLRLAIGASRVPCRLHQLPNGNEVLHWFKNLLMQDQPELPDVILLDLGLPQLDGFQLLEELSQAKLPVRSIPIVILTGYEDFDYLHLNYPLPITSYLTKPCKAEEIREILLRIHRGKSAASANY